MDILGMKEGNVFPSSSVLPERAAQSFTCTMPPKETSSVLWGPLKTPLSAGSRKCSQLRTVKTRISQSQRVCCPSRSVHKLLQ